MRRSAIVLACVGILGCVILLAWPDAPAYLAAWLAWISLPLGALTLVAAAELMGLPDGPMLGVLRRMLLLLPLGALLAIPLIREVATPILYAGLLAVWCGLALLLAVERRGRPRGALGGLALMVHAVLASGVAFQGMQALAPGLGSSSAGLLLISGQAAAAACAAVVMRAAAGPLTAAPGLLIVGLLGAWGFLHFTQYLVIWSANLPAEITWYQQRTGGLGEALVWAEAAIVLAAFVMLPSRLGRLPMLAGSLAALLLFGHLMEVLWLITPAFRGNFSVRLADLVALVGLGGLSLGLLSTLTGRRTHAAA